MSWPRTKESRKAAPCVVVSGLLLAVATAAEPSAMWTLAVGIVIAVFAAVVVAVTIFAWCFLYAHFQEWVDRGE